MRRQHHGIQALAPLALVAALTGCAAGLGAAAGAAGVIAYNDRGAEANVESSVQAVASATEAAFSELGIATTSRNVQDGGAEIEIQGRSGDMEVVVEIEDEGGGLTEVEVTAKEGTLDYDRSYAEDVLRRIIDRL